LARSRCRWGVGLVKGRHPTARWTRCVGASRTGIAIRTIPPTWRVAAPWMCPVTQEVAAAEPAAVTPAWAGRAAMAVGSVLGGGKPDRAEWLGLRRAPLELRGKTLSVRAASPPMAGPAFLYHRRAIRWSPLGWPAALLPQTRDPLASVL